MTINTALKTMTEAVKPYVRGEDFVFSLRESGFCCGMLEVGGFSWKDNAFYMYRTITEKTGEELKAIFKEVMRRTSRSMLYATTISVMHREERALRLAGWEEVTDFQNANTNNNVTFWTFKG